MAYLFRFTMWGFASKAASASTLLKKKYLLNPTQASSECSDDDVSSNTSRDEVLECPICWESFNIVENVPYVLWCGHTLCKNCILGLQWAVVKLPTLPIQLPFLVSCPWCNLLSLRLIYKGNLKFPRKNFFLLWMVESLNGDRAKSRSSCCGDQIANQFNHINQLAAPEVCVHNHQLATRRNEGRFSSSYLNGERLHSSLRKSLIFFVHLTAKFPLVLVFLLIVLYAIPACAAILVLYILITVVFALPSFLVLYFAYPSLDWLVREIVT